MVRLGVEVAFNRFVDLLADPEPDAGDGRRTYVDLGRGEFHAGRTLDSLLAAYRVGARLAWRRFVEAGVSGGLEPDTIYALGEAIFAYIDELSAESAEGYAEEQTAAAGERERRRRRLVRLLAEDPPARPEAVRTAATAPAGRCRAAASPRSWPRPRRATDAPLDAIAARFARRLGEGAIGAEAAGAAIVFVPDPDAPGRRRRLDAAAEEHPAALGPTVDWTRAPRRRRARAIAAHRLAVAAAPGGGRALGCVADDHLATLLLAADPASPPTWPRRGSRRSPTWPRARARGCARRSPPGSTGPARCRPSPPRSASIRRPSATACASCATCSGSGWRTPRRASSCRSRSRVP